MEVGDLVRHIYGKTARQVGVITGIKYSNPTQQWKYKVLWACIQKEEYWFTSKEVEAI